MCQSFSLPTMLLRLSILSEIQLTIQLIRIGTMRVYTSSGDLEFDSNIYYKSLNQKINYCSMYIFVLLVYLGPTFKITSAPISLEAIPNSLTPEAPKKPKPFLY